MLQEQVARRELDMIAAYLAENPEVDVPPELQAKLDALPGGSARRASAKETLTELREKAGITTRTGGASTA